MSACSRWGGSAIAFVSAICVCCAADSQPSASSGGREHENVEWSVSYAYGLTDETRSLPRVLLIGDSVCRAYENAVRDRLAGKMNVSYWTSSYCVTSAAYLPLLSVCLDESKYDVVHINNGLHSLSTPDEAWSTSLRAALRTIRLKQPGARIVWASSTPLKDEKLTEKVRRLNGLASNAIRAIGGIAEDDLFALMDPLDRNQMWADVFHFKADAIDLQAKQVAEACVVAIQDGGRIPAVRTIPHELDILLRTGHIQGAACSAEGVYLSHSGGIEFIGWDGKFVRRVDAPFHLGDIAYANGKVYGAIGLTKPTKSGGRGMIRVWNDRLEPVTEKEFSDQLDGIAVLDGVVYAGVDRWGSTMGNKLHEGCRVKRLDMSLNELDDVDLDLGYKIAYGVQTMTTDGRSLFLGNYGGTSRFTPDLKNGKRIDFDCAEGFDMVPPGVFNRKCPMFFAVRSLGGNIHGWRKDPQGNPPRIELDFFEYHDGRFVDVTDRQVFR